MNPNQQFCLRWNNHQSTLISVFEALLESGTLVDCTLAAEGQYLKAHKVVLSACSPYLGMLLSQDFEKHPILILKDVKFAQLKSMLDYMYRGEVNISQDQLGTFLKAAESLQIKGLTDSGGANSNNNQGSEAEDYNARHRKHLALMAAAAARSRSPIIEQQSQHQHQRWMNNGGGMHHEMMRDGSISPSPRKRKRPRRPSLGHNPLQNGHDEMPLQPLIQQAQATNNNVLAQSLAAPPLSHPPKCVTPPPAHTPDIKRDEEEVSSPSPKLEPIEHNNNDSVPFKPLANEKNPVASPDSKESGHVNNNHSNASLDGGHSEDEGEEERKKEETEEENNEEMLDEDIEEDMDEENSNGGNQAQRATMANAHWLMTDALPNSDSFQDSKVEVREEIQKIKLVQQDKLIATPPSSQQITLTPTSSLIATPPQTATPTSPVKLSGTPLQLLSNNNLVQGSQLQSLLTGGTQQLKLLNPLQLQGAGQTQKIYLTNISRLITINPQKPGAPGVPTLLLDRGPASTITVNQNTTNTTPGNPPTTNEVLSCNMCGKKYQWKQSLTRHIREHRCAKGPQHSCPCCNLSFKHTSSLNKHVMLCTAVHSRLMQAQGDGLPIGDDEVMEVKEDEEMDEEDGESCDNNDAIVDDLEEEEEEEEDELDPLNTT